MGYKLILGGAGFIGTNLAYEYVKNNKDVIILDNFDAINKTKFSAISKHAVLINGRLSDNELLNNLFSQYDVEEVIHLICRLLPSSSVTDFSDEYMDVTIPTISLIGIMAKYNVKKLIYLSSGGTVYGNYKIDGYYGEEDQLRPINYYGLNKFQMEEYIKYEARKNKIEYLILRPSNPFGYYQNRNCKQGIISVILNRMMCNAEIEIWGDGSVVRDYMPIDYLCKSIVCLDNASVKNEIFNIGSGIGLSVNDLIEIVENELNVKLKIKYINSRDIDSNKVILNIEKLKGIMNVEKIDMSHAILDYYNLILDKKHDE